MESLQLPWLYQFLCFLLLFHLHFLATFSYSSTQLCPHDQSFALLQFKRSLSISSSNCVYHDEIGRAVQIASYPKTYSWKDGTDCCSWDGVTCDSLTGHVIGLDLSCSWLTGIIPPNSSLFLLPHLKSLNLAFNNFSNSRISSQFGWFASLTHLNLSNSFFSGLVPSQISHQSRLISLDLSHSESGFKLELEAPILEAIVQNLTEVRELFLDWINMSSIAPSSLMNLSSSLTSLGLFGCELRGHFPSNIFYLPKLKLLDLGYNPNLRGYFPKSNWSSPLELLDVTGTLFSGELPDSIGNLESLKYLFLDDCNFTGSIPSSLKNLKQLTELVLEFNNFTGPIPDIFGNLSKLAFLVLTDNNFGGQLPSSVFNLSQLESLDLSGNQLVGSIPYQVSRVPNLSILGLSNNLLNGTIPSWVFTLPSLQYMILHNNKFTGHINEFLSRSWKTLDLASNKLDGPLPISIFEQVNLTYLYLSSNNLSGKVEMDLFSKLENLKYLHLSYNSLSLVSTNIHVNSTLPNLLSLSFSSCNITEFPSFLQASKNLQSLDLSKNKIHGQIPKWMWDVGKDSLSYLNLSNNLLTSIEKLPWNNLETLDLDSNLLQGSLPIPPLIVSVFSISNNNLTGELPSLIGHLSSLSFLDISHNSLTGELSSLICNSSSLEILDISHNNLNGVIPPCLGNLSESLSVLNLQKNNFHGTINAKFSKSCGLHNLNLNDNHLGGLLPRSLVNCTNLEVVDFGNNQIDDKFPYWLGSLSELQVLVLRSNKFHGNIQNFKANHSFPKLKIFDLSNNDFEGALPTEFIKNLNAMMDVNEGKSDLQYMGDRDFSYDYSVTVTMKSFDIELVKILTTLTSIDLSNNKFEGEIPEAIGLLNWLRGLNFSHNMLTGDIPPSMGKLTNLEWLDLSSNKLVGEIPRQLADLTFLAVLNLSQNQLVGSIPRVKQFNTFENDSYRGNLGLCGFPLTKTCNNDEPPPSTFQDEDDSESSSGFGWKVVLMGYGCGVIFGLAMGYLVFRIGKPKWFVTLVEGKQYQRAKRSKRNSRRSGGRRN